MYGRKYMGVERSTFLIDKDGRIARSWHKVKVAGHADEVLAAAEKRRCRTLERRLAVPGGTWPVRPSRWHRTAPASVGEEQ